MCDPVQIHVIKARSIGKADCLDADFVAGGQQHGAVHRVLELANIARPAVMDKKAPRLERKRPGRETVAARVARGEVFGQGDDIGRTVSQRRKLQVDHVQPIKEILAKAPRTSLRLQVAI